jgi:hypothetical protein
MAIVVHSPYSPDLVPLDFCLFGHVKGLFGGESFETGEQLSSAIDRLMRSLENWTLIKVFLESMTSLERCIETNGDYVG